MTALCPLWDKFVADVIANRAIGPLQQILPASAAKADGGFEVLVGEKRCGCLKVILRI
jgi:hypothetical protein